ncbi:MAG: endonuclease/exonuclease/phosphatase family protein [Rhodobacteraceae bacterium]|nr:endonuclease/exonuclease/phosphatase family protein [Paracoccaceae bacterium]
MSLKVTTFNIEWMVSFFDGDWNQWDGTIVDTFPGKSLGSIHLEAIPDVPALCTRIANVITAVDPDILAVQEGPPREEQMQLFVDTFLGGAYTVFGANRQWQRNYALVKNDLAQHCRAEDWDDDTFNGNWKNAPYQPWGSIKLDDRKVHNFHRQPLVLHVTPPGEPALELVAVHTKSKFSKLKTPQQWEERETAAVKDALLVRKKLSVEMQMLRRYFIKRLAEVGNDHAFLILGDFNDGPLAEEMEREFLVNNIIDELVGSIMAPHAVLTHGMTPDVIASSATTRFRNPMKNGELTEELIDHIVMSNGLLTGSSGYTLDQATCRVETDAFQAQNDEPDDAENRQLRPSDHLPVSAILNT